MGRSATTLLVLFSLSALAEDPFARGIDAVPVKLTPTVGSGLTLDGADLPQVGSFRLMPLLDFNVGILALKAGNARLGDLLPFRTDLHILAAYQALNRLELAADLPVTLVNVSNFKLLNDQGFPQQAPRAFGLGALRAMGRFQIVRQSEIPIIGLAAIMEIRAPTGDGFSFMSDAGWVFAPRLAAERRFGPIRVLANGGWRFRTTPGRYLNLYVGHEFAMGAGVIFEAPDAWKFKRNEFLADLNVVTPAEAPFTFRDADALKTPFELMVGARTMFNEHWGLQVSVARGLGENGYGRETFRFSVGLRYEYVPILDADGDGVPDKVDGCPNVAADKTHDADGDGCPDEPEIKDRDGDGVPDLEDQCPDEKGPRELDGCPDKDQDQIPDVVDKCPDQPGPAELNGCPPPPEEEPVVLESERIRIRNQVLYEFGSAKIATQSYPLLDEVARVLDEHKDVGPVVIEGHTDNIGPRLFNIDLSKRRAKAVEDYLVQKGIDRGRLRSDGFGFDRPIAPNDTVLNRAKNRRTEFRLVDEIDVKPGYEPKPGSGVEKVPNETPAAKPATPAAKPATPPGPPPKAAAPVPAPKPATAAPPPAPSPAPKK